MIALEDDIKIVDSKVDNPILNLFFEESKEKTKRIFDLTLADLDKYEENIMSFYTIIFKQGFVLKAI